MMIIVLFVSLHKLFCHVNSFYYVTSTIRCICSTENVFLNCVIQLWLEAQWWDNTSFTHSISLKLMVFSKCESDLCLLLTSLMQLLLKRHAESTSNIFSLSSWLLKPNLHLMSEIKYSIFREYLLMICLLRLKATYTSSIVSLTWANSFQTWCRTCFVADTIS